MSLPMLTSPQRRGERHHHRRMRSKSPAFCSIHEREHHNQQSAQTGGTATVSTVWDVMAAAIVARNESEIAIEISAEHAKHAQFCQIWSARRIRPGRYQFCAELGIPENRSHHDARVRVSRRKYLLLMYLRKRSLGGGLYTFQNPVLSRNTPRGKRSLYDCSILEPSLETYLLPISGITCVLPQATTYRLRPPSIW